MGKLGRRGIFSTGASLGGGGGISTPSKIVHKIVHKLDISFENEMELQSEILKFKSLALDIQLDNEQELSADLKIARNLGISLENEQELSADLKIARRLGISFDNKMKLESEILKFKSLGIQFENEQELVSKLAFVFGNALEFDGVNDYVNLGSGGAILSNAFEWTISLWIKPTKTGVSLGGGNTSANDLLYLINSTLFRVQFAGGSAALSRLNFTIPSVTLNQWHHVCITKDSSNDVRVYWNGTESVTGALPTNDTLNMYQLGSYRRTGLWFDGVMDEFGLDVTTAASLPQVSDLYNNGNGASFLEVMPSARVNYHLNEVSGSSVAVDATTNGNDGTLNNFDTATCWVPH